LRAEQPSGIVAASRAESAAMQTTASGEYATVTTPDEPRSIDLERFLPYRLNAVASLVSQSLSRVYSRRYGIGVPEWRVLVTLGQFGMMSGKAVGAHSYMHKTKVSRAVAVLEKRRLVGRKPNATDMREVLFSLTPAGLALYREVTPIALRFADRLADALQPSDRSALDRIIERLTQRSIDLAAEMAAEEAEICGRASNSARENAA
jgi:DNA-binding MarR family transcriptional regulator